MLNPKKPSKPLSNDLSYLLKTLQFSVLCSESEIAYANELLEQHHYLGSLRAVGERLYYFIGDENGDWLAVMVFVAAARRLRHRDAWIGWTDEQRRRRLPLVVNKTHASCFCPSEPLQIWDRQFSNAYPPDLDGKCVSLDALHTQQQTATELMLEHGADYFFTVKGNQPNLSAQIKNRIGEPDKDFPFLSPNQ